VGWKFITMHERRLGQLFLDGLPEGWRLHGPPTMEGRVSTFSLTPPDESPEQAATRLGEAGFAVWHGNSYAVEVFAHLGLPEGALRIGIVHTNTEDEVARLLAALPRG
jgi:selenocysteine lyase/cysteine desulfurase